MKYRILLPLFLFFLAYRLTYWGVAMTVAPNVYFNAIADTLISFYVALGIFKVSEKGFRTNSIGISILLFSSACIVLWGLHYLIYSLTGGMNETFSNTFYRFTFQFFDVFTLVFIGASIAFAWFKNIESQDRSRKYLQLIQEKQQAELKFLKAQINPHFIFNTLNAIHFSIEKENVQARKLVNDFADLFRFQLYESDQPYILLQKELEFINKYIQINEVRMSENYSIDLQMEGEVAQKYVPPLLLIPFVENAFKHASNTIDLKAEIQITIKVHERYLYFAVKNTVGENKVVANKAGGVGLENVQKRLEILFPTQHHIQIDPTKDHYTVQVKIPLQDEMLNH